MDAWLRRISLLYCNLCSLRSSWLITLSRYLRRGAVLTEARGQEQRGVEEEGEEWSGEGCVPPPLEVLDSRDTPLRGKKSKLIPRLLSLPTGVCLLHKFG